MAKGADLGLRTHNINQNTPFTYMKQNLYLLARCNMMLSTIHTSSGSFLLYFIKRERLLHYATGYERH